MSELTEDQTAWLDGMDEVLALLRKNPDLIPTTGANFYRHGGREAAEFARRALLLGPADKEATETFYNVVRKFGPHKFEVYTDRAVVCERVVVETEEVTEEVPDPDLVAAVPKIEVTRTVERVEWVCPPSLHELAASES